MLPIAFKIKPTSLYCNSVLTIANDKSDDVDGNDVLAVAYGKFG